MHERRCATIGKVAAILPCLSEGARKKGCEREGTRKLNFGTLYVPYGLYGIELMRSRWDRTHAVVILLEGELSFIIKSLMTRSSSLW